MLEAVEDSVNLLLFFLFALREVFYGPLNFISERSSRPEVFCEKGALKKSVIFTRKQEA